MVVPLSRIANNLFALALTGGLLWIIYQKMNNKGLSNTIHNIKGMFTWRKK